MTVRPNHSDSMLHSSSISNTAEKHNFFSFGRNEHNPLERRSGKHRYYAVYQIYGCGAVDGLFVEKRPSVT